MAYSVPIVPPESREDCVYLCSAAEEASRFEDMVEYMRRVTTFEQELHIDERNLFSVAYKELVGLRRKSLRHLTDMGAALAPATEREQQLLDAMRARIRGELIALCEEALLTIQENLLPRSVHAESTVFYHKMTADYLRYLAEFSAGGERRAYGDRAAEAYGRASALAEKLGATHPVRLGLALNLSVFHFEIRSDVREAFEVAVHALDEAKEHFDEMEQAHAKDSMVVMQLLQDNIHLWSAAANDPQDDAEQHHAVSAMETTDGKNGIHAGVETPRVAASQLQAEPLVAV
ncbi:14-3-3 protein [Auricularia subglabra TFB-10046 SS5]|nr:14-3-3 protein [Auricularia subglabra TFB-10046 SS5]